MNMQGVEKFVPEEVPFSTNFQDPIIIKGINKLDCNDFFISFYFVFIMRLGNNIETQS